MLKLEEFKEMLPGFEMVESNRLSTKIGVRARGGIFGEDKGYTVFKLEDQTGIAIYVDGTEGEENPILHGPEILFPKDFEDRHWDTVRKIGEATGLNYEQVKDTAHLPDSFVERLGHNHPYLSAIEALYDRVESYAAHIAIQHAGGREFFGMGPSELVVTPFKVLRDAPVVGGDTLKLRLMTKMGLKDSMNEEDGEKTVALVDRLKTIKDATADKWRQVETMELAYAGGLRTLYEPKFG